MINHKSCLIKLVSNNLCDIKEPTHCSKRVGDTVPGVVVTISLSLISSVFHIHTWVGWVSEIKLDRLIAVVSGAFTY